METVLYKEESQEEKEIELEQIYFNKGFNDALEVFNKTNIIIDI